MLMSISMSTESKKKGDPLTQCQKTAPQEENRHDTECPPYRRSHSKHIRIASNLLLIPVVPAVSPSLHGSIQPYV